MRYPFSHLGRPLIFAVSRRTPKGIVLLMASHDGQEERTVSMIESTALDDQLTTHQFLKDPYPLYRQFQNNHPVHWSDAWDCWLLTRYDDVNAALRDPKRFSSVGTTGRFLDQLPANALTRLQPLYKHFKGGMVRLDPPEHNRIRGITNKAFTPRVVEALRPRIQRIVDQLIDGFQQRGCFDLITDFAYPLPARTLAGLFGFPTKDCDRFKAWSVEIAAIHGTGGADPVVAEQSQAALMKAREWLNQLVKDRRQQPLDDLLTRLVQAEEKGERLNEAEMFSTCVTFMIGGHETTTNLIGNGMLALLQDSSQWRMLQQDLTLVEPAVEEMLRYDAPTQRAHRIAAVDFELRGKMIRQGDFIQAVLGAANRDPNQFPQPDRFDITRKNNKHLSFGAGPHYCVGAPLSRLEAQIAVLTLMRLLPNLRLASKDSIVLSKNNFFRGRTKLPLLFDVNT